MTGRDKLSAAAGLLESVDILLAEPTQRALAVEVLEHVIRLLNEARVEL